MKLNILKTDGTDSGATIELNDAIFACEPNQQLVYEDVRSYLSAQRQGTAKTKGRTEVRGGGKKAFKQKGTGGARRGSLRSPLLKGGGTVFGPKPREYEVRLTKKMKQIARKSALTYKAIEQAIVVVEDFTFQTPKTKEFIKLITALNLSDKKVLILTGATDLSVYKSARNVPKVKTLEAFRPSTYDIMNADILLLQKSAVQTLESTFTEYNAGVNA
jgi:large subunit ribosomal protein L4